jgi:hypothetical protein
MKRAESVAQVGQVGIVEGIEDCQQESVTEPSEPSYIERPSAADEA